MATAGQLICLLFVVVASGCASGHAPMATANNRQVGFELLAPQARSVVLLGDFNNWAPPGTALTGPDRGGNWSLVIVVPGLSRRINYVYLVNDSEYRTDNQRPSEPDDYGGRNNILYIP